MIGKVGHSDDRHLATSPDQIPMRQALAHSVQQPDHLFILHGVKTGLAGVLALFAAEALRLQYPEWSAFTVLTLMMVHYHPGSIALKSIFRFVGTVVGAALGVWIVSDYFSSPVLFLGLTFVVMSIASYKVGQLSSKMAPYAYFMTGVTLIIVESAGLTQPDKEWFVALSRMEETFVGITAVMIVTPLFRSRRPRLEFQQLASSAIEQLKNLTKTELRDISEGSRSNSDLAQEQTAVLRKLLTLDSLLLAERRESLSFRANTAILFKARHLLRNLFQAVLDLSQSQVDYKVLSKPLQRQLGAVRVLFDHRVCSVGRASTENPPIFANSVQALDEEINRWLQSGELKELPAEQLAAYLRCLNALRRIEIELLSWYDLENQWQGSGHDLVIPSDPRKVQRKIDRRLAIIGLKGGLVSVASLFLLVWLHLPGATIMPVAAWLAVIFTSFEIPVGRPGHVRSFQNLLQMALYGFLIVLVVLVLAPLMSNYWFMNLILFCILFAHGYFASKMPGMAFWMLGTLFLVPVLVALNAQRPVPFAAIMDGCLGVMIGLTIGVTVARVLWPRLPQSELREEAALFSDAARSAAEANSELLISKINSTLSTLPLDIARTTAALGFSQLLRQEQLKWNRLVPVLISLSTQLPRLVSIRAMAADSPEVPLYLEFFREDFHPWTEALGRFFRQPTNKNTLPSLRGLIDRLKQRMEGLKTWELTSPSSNGHSRKILMEVNEYLVAAELMQECGDIALSLRLVEYSGDYFL